MIQPTHFCAKEIKTDKKCLKQCNSCRLKTSGALLQMQQNEIIHDYSGKITRQDIKDAVDYVFRTTQKPQTIKGVRGCIKYGFKNFDDFSHCGLEYCTSCNSFNEIFIKISDMPSRCNCMICEGTNITKDCKNKKYGLR